MNQNRIEALVDCVKTKQLSTQLLFRLVGPHDPTQVVENHLVQVTGSEFNVKRVVEETATGSDRYFFLLNSSIENVEIPEIIATRIQFDSLKRIK